MSEHCDIHGWQHAHRRCPHCVFCACHDDGPPMPNGRCPTCLLPRAGRAPASPPVPATRRPYAGAILRCLSEFLLTMPEGDAPPYTTQQADAIRAMVAAARYEFDDLTAAAAPVPDAAPDAIREALDPEREASLKWRAEHNLPSMLYPHEALALFARESALRDEVARRIAEVEAACGMPLDMVPTTLDAHRATAQADHERAESAFAALRVQNDLAIERLNRAVAAEKELAEARVTVDQRCAQRDEQEARAVAAEAREVEAREAIQRAKVLSRTWWTRSKAAGRYAAPRVARWPEPGATTPPRMSCPKCHSARVDLRCWNCGWTYEPPARSPVPGTDDPTNSSRGEP